MKRTLVVVAVVVGFAAAAGASVLTVASDKTTYNPGETITLTVSGDAMGATAYGVFGRLQFSNAAAVSVNTKSQKLVNPSWTKSALLSGSGFSDAFDQICCTSNATTATNLPAQNPFSTITLIAQLVGVPTTVNADWNTNSASGFQLNFFGLTSAPGASFTIIPVPEPTTVALMALGLVGLVLGGVRRRS